jgi:hypothetical protein
MTNPFDPEIVERARAAHNEQAKEVVWEAYNDEVYAVDYGEWICSCFTAEMAQHIAKLHNDSMEFSDD